MVGDVARETPFRAQRGEGPELLCPPSASVSRPRVTPHLLGSWGALAGFQGVLRERSPLEKTDQMGRFCDEVRGLGLE